MSDNNPLTPKEIETLRMLAGGLTPQQIAAREYAGLRGGDLEFFRRDKCLRARIDHAMLVLQQRRNLEHLAFERLAGQHVGPRAAALLRSLVQYRGAVARRIVE